MNIRLIQSVTWRRCARVMTIATAAAMAALGGGVASAQSNQYGLMTSDQWGPETQVVPASAVATAADVSGSRLAPGSISQAFGTFSGGSADSQFGNVAQVSFGCQSCSQTGCYGGCNACGGGPLANPCGTPCDPYRYVFVEALYMQRQGSDGYGLIRNADLEEFDFEIAPRITIGNLPNCVTGYEFTFTGPIESDRRLTVSDPGSRVTTTLLGSNAINQQAIDPFWNANLQTLTYDSDYWSAELNKTMVGWDVAKVLFGGRMIRIDEDLVYTTQKDVFGSYGSLTSRPENTLAVIQGGLDLLYPVRPHLYTDFRGRVGGYVNFAESNIRLTNTGSSLIHNVRDEEEFGAMIEVALGFRYQLGEILSIRAMGEMWYLSEVATASDQINGVVSERLGTELHYEDLFYVGVSVGAEVKF